MEFKDQVIDYFNKLISYNINLVEYAQRNKIPIYVNGNLNKGWKGNVIEHMLNIPSNSKKGSDYIGLEIKTVPIIKKDSKIVVKETTCLSVIDIKSITTQRFEDSDLFKKVNKTLFVLINVEDENNPQLDSTYYLDFNKEPTLLEEMKKDYNNLVEHILDNIYHDENLDKNFSGKLGNIIQPRPKMGKKGDYSWAFYLKRKVLESFLNIPIKKQKIKI